jgi:hypothetical protein
MHPFQFLNVFRSWRLLPVLVLLGCGGSGPPKKYGSGTENSSPANAPTATATVPPLHLRLYLESSASMFPYEAPGTDGQFKAALQNLVDNFEGLRAGSTQFYTVNDAVYPLKINTSQFIRTNDLFSLTRGVGDAKYTDFEKIFREVLRDLPEGRVSVLVSDLIYSDKFMQPGSGQKNLNAIQSLMQNVFAGAAKTTSLLLIKASAGFSGPYFSISGGKKAYAGDRPYYLCIAARHATLRALLTRPENEPLRRFDQLPGYQNQLFFGPDQAPFYTVLLKDPNQRGKLVQEAAEMQQNKRTGSMVVHRLDNAQPDPRGNELAVVVGVDLGGYALPEATKTDAASYAVESPEGFTVKNVQAVGGGTLPYTHKLTLSTTTPRPGGQREVRVGLRRVFPPQWVRTTSVADDGNVQSASFAKTTFGFLPLTQGIENAYNPGQRTDYFRLTISLHN